MQKMLRLSRFTIRKYQQLDRWLANLPLPGLNNKDR